MGKPTGLAKEQRRTLGRLRAVPGWIFPKRLSPRKWSIIKDFFVAEAPALLSAG